MNYQRIHNSLIERGKNRVLKCYSENHHIIPKCMGGSNDQENLVRLTAEEHYVAHQLLVKIHPKHRRLVIAALAMSISDKRNRRNNNKLYGWLKRKHAKNMSGKTISKKTRRKMSESHTGKKFSKEHKRRISESSIGKKMSDSRTGANNPMYGKIPWNKGKKHPKKTIKKMSEARIGKRHSEETKRKISESLKKYHEDLCT